MSSCCAVESQMSCIQQWSPCLSSTCWFSVSSWLIRKMERCGIYSFRMFDLWLTLGLILSQLFSQKRNAIRFHALFQWLISILTVIWSCHNSACEAAGTASAHVPGCKSSLVCSNVRVHELWYRVRTTFPRRCDFHCSHKMWRHKTRGKAFHRDTFAVIDRRNTVREEGELCEEGTSIMRAINIAWLVFSSQCLFRSPPAFVSSNYYAFHALSCESS